MHYLLSPKIASVNLLTELYCPWYREMWRRSSQCMLHVDVRKFQKIYVFREFKLVNSLAIYSFHIYNIVFMLVKNISSIVMAHQHAVKDYCARYGGWTYVNIW